MIAGGNFIDDELRVLHHCDTPPCVRPDHLFAGTNADNIADMMAKGRHAWAVHPETVARGERVRHAKLTEVQVLEIKARLVAGETPTEIAADYPVKPAAISHIKHGRNWRGARSA